MALHMQNTKLKLDGARKSVSAALQHRDKLVLALQKEVQVLNQSLEYLAEVSAQTEATPYQIRLPQLAQAIEKMQIAFQYPDGTMLSSLFPESGTHLLDTAALLVKAHDTLVLEIINALHLLDVWKQLHTGMPAAAQDENAQSEWPQINEEITLLNVRRSVDQQPLLGYFNF